jgi:hypothetical protein
MNPDLFITLVFVSLVGIVAFAVTALVLSEVGRDRKHATLGGSSRRTPVGRRPEQAVTHSPYRTREMKQ